MKISRTSKLMAAACALAFAQLGCAERGSGHGSGAESGPAAPGATNPAEQPYGYAIEGADCATGEHVFPNLAEACRGLLDEELNRGCARTERREGFRLGGCESALGMNADEITPDASTEEGRNPGAGDPGSPGASGNSWSSWSSWWSSGWSFSSGGAG